MKDLVDTLKDIASTRVIDLRRRYEMRSTLLPSGVWEVVDLVTFDDDPESSMHLRGHGDSIGEATTDLLEKMAEVASRYQEAVSYSPFEPATMVTRHRQSEDYDDEA